MDPAKVAEAQAELAAGEKEIKTTMLKWKADWGAAQPHFARAGTLFRAAGMLDSALSAWRRSADASLKLGNVKQAVITLEGCARELMAAPSPPAASRSQASAFLAEAGGLLYEAGEPPRAAELKLRAGKLIEGAEPDRAAALYDEAAAFFDGDSVRGECAGVHAAAAAAALPPARSLLVGLRCRAG